MNKAASGTQVVSYFADEQPPSPTPTPNEYHHPDGRFKRKESQREFHTRQQQLEKAHAQHLDVWEYHEHQKWDAFEAIVAGGVHD